MKNLFKALLFFVLVNPAIAEGPIGPGDGQIVDLQDGNGNIVTSTSGALNVNVTGGSGGTVTANQGTSPWVDNISQFGGSNVVTGTGAAGAGIPRVTVSNDSNVLATQSGTWNINNVSGTVSLPTGAATSALQSTVQGSVTGGTAGTASELAGGQFNTVAPTLTNGQQAALQLASDGSLKTTASVTVPGTVTVVQPTAANLNAQVVGNVASGSADSGNPIKVGGVFNTTPATLTNGQRGDVQLSANGAVIVSGASAVGVAPTNNPISVSGVDGGGLKRILQTDTNGKLNVDQHDGNGVTITSSTNSGGGVHTGLDNNISGSTLLEVTGTGAALNQFPIAATDVSSYRSVGIQLTVTGTNTSAFEGSNDNVTFSSVLCTNAASINAGAVSTATATGMFICPVAYRYFRVRTSVFTSGTGVAVAEFSPLPVNDMGLRESIIVSGTITSVTNATTSNVANAVVADRASTATVGGAGTSATITPGVGNQSFAIQFNVTAISGPSPTMDLVVQESWDTGTTWFDKYHFERVTVTGQYVTPLMRFHGNRIRYSWVIGGAPAGAVTYTFSLNRISGDGYGEDIHRYFDRTMDPTTLNSASPGFVVEGCSALEYGVSRGAGGSGDLRIALDLSEDGSTWIDTGSPLDAIAASTPYEQRANMKLGKFARLRISNPIPSSTIIYSFIRCSDSGADTPRVQPVSEHGSAAVVQVRNDYTSVNVTTAAYVQLIASTSDTITRLEVFDSSGQTLEIGVGAAASEVVQFIVFPGGNGAVPLRIPAGSRVAIKALSGTANTGELDINFYK